MDISKLTQEQRDIYQRLKIIFESEEQFQTWLSLPNKMFRGKSPLGVLLSNNFEYFDRYFDSSYIQ